MKNIFLTLAASLIALFVFSQESSNSKTALAKFDKYYNASSYDDIFSLLSLQAQAAMPIQKHRDFFTQLKSTYGNITKRTFVENQGSYAIYKTEFEKGILTFTVAADNSSSIAAFFVKPYVEDTSPKLERSITKLDLPFKGEWTIFWGGDTKEQNHHVATKFQKNAFDIIITSPENKSFRTTGKVNEDYYAFGQDITAPCEAEVVLAVDGIKDNIPGILNPVFLTGNSVILKTKNNEYMLFAHFKQGSVKVKQGDIVKPGQLLGLCGNSGNSSEPHLHFHIQNIEDLSTGTGVKCYFDKLIVNGIEKTDYSPVKDDRVKSLK